MIAPVLITPEAQRSGADRERVLTLGLQNSILKARIMIPAKPCHMYILPT